MGIWDGFSRSAAVAEVEEELTEEEFLAFSDSIRNTVTSLRGSLHNYTKIFREFAVELEAAAQN